MLARPVLAALAAVAFLAPSPADAAGKKYALLVGVKEYDHSSLPDLKYTENDVEDLAVLLTDAGFSQVVLMTTTLGKKDAAVRPTAANIRAQIKKLSAKVTRGDMLIIGLAGHGLQVALTDPKTKRDKEESFFCPADARPRPQAGEEELKKTMIPLTELFKELDESGAGVRLLLVDACRNDPKLGRNVDVDNLPRPARGTAVLFSCKGGEKAFESDKLGRGHGVFFHHVIEALKGRARNDKGEVTWSRLAEYVIDKVSDDVPVLIGEGARQTPHEVKNLEGKAPVLVGKLRVRKAAVYDRAVDHFIGLTRDVDSKAAAALFREAADSGHEAAGAALGWLMYTGQGVPLDRIGGARKIRENMPGLKRAVEGGDAFAMIILGVAMLNAAGADRDKEGAASWFRKSAAKKFPRAYTDLGWLYASGQGVGKDLRESARMYRLGAEAGDPHGMLSLALAYEFGEGVEKDDREALRWYRRAAEKGHAEALAIMGNATYWGWGGAEKDSQAAVAWYRKAVGKDHPRGMLGLGNAYFDGRGVDQDDREAVRWYRRAADRNNARAMFNLGWMLEQGRGVEKSHEEALKWYRKAAEFGEASGMVALGNAYSVGWGGAHRDEKEAVRWYRKAADKNSGEGMFRLADMFENGRGVGRDSAEALRWYRKAASAGYRRANEKVKELAGE